MNNGNERVLDTTQYEVRYSWLSWDNQIVEDGVIVDLDFTITKELQAEWVAREISRFLNQMRKDADYIVSDRVACIYQTDSEYLQDIVDNFTDFLQAEALLSTVTRWSDTGDISSEFESEEGKITFTLQK